MATYTEKLGLKMPAQTDFYNVDDFNENFRKIDESIATNADIQHVLTLADPIRSNRAPTTADVQFAGKLWVVPKMTFNNMMPNALAQAAGNWRATAATVSTSGTAATLVGDGTASTIVGEVDMTSVRANDIVYIAANMAVTTDANGAVLELLCGSEVIATASMSVPVAGDNIRLIGHTNVDAAGALKLRVTTMYNSASAQLGKGVTVSDITILNLTADMCQNFAGIEFSEDAATTYIDTYGNFQTKVYELSEYWWICRGSYSGQYSWQRYDDYTNAVINEYSTNYQNSKATTAEAQAGTNDTHWMTPLKAQQFLTNRIATTAEAQAGADNTKVMTPVRVADQITAKIATQTEVNTGTNNTKIVTPATLAGKIATQSEAQTGSNNTKIMTPLRVKNFHDAIKASVDEAKAGSLTTKWINPSTLMSAIDWYERSSYMAFCANVNADALDAAFGKNNVTNIKAVGNQLAMYSWFKGVSASTYPYTVTRTLHTLSQIYSNINAVLEVEQNSAVIDLIQASPFAKAIRDAAIASESVCCQIIASFSGLSNPTSFTTVAALTNNSTFMNSQTNVARAFKYPTFLSVFCSNNTHWTRMASYTACMKAFQASSEVNTYLEANKTTLLTYLNGATSTTASTALTGNVVYIHSCSQINSGNWSNNSFSLGVDLSGNTYSSSGSGDPGGAASKIGRKFFKPSTCSKGGGGGVTCYYKKIS